MNAEQRKGIETEAQELKKRIVEYDERISELENKVERPRETLLGVQGYKKIPENVSHIKIGHA